jgi:hypothetical protein
MGNRELDFIIDWCRRKTFQKTRQCGYTGKRGQGYEEAMLNVMSYLHSLKKEVSNGEK